MADGKKNIPDAGKVDEPPKPGKVEPAKAASPVQDQPAPTKAEAHVIEDASKVVTPPTAEQTAPMGKEAPKGKDVPAPSKEGAPQPGKDEKQTTIPGMGDPAPAGKVVNFAAARDEATKGKPPEKAVAQDKDKQAAKAKDAAKPRRGRPPKADKAAPDKAKPQPRDKMSQSKPPVGKGDPVKTEAPAATEQPPVPRDATRSVKEEIVYCDFPSEHWTRIRTNNVIERLNREIRRRTRVVGSFPDGNSALMLVCARLRHVAGTQWGNKKYMNMKHLEAALEDAPIAG